MKAEGRRHRTVVQNTTCTIYKRYMNRAVFFPLYPTSCVLPPSTRGKLARGKPQEVSDCRLRVYNRTAHANHETMRRHWRGLADISDTL